MCDPDDTLFDEPTPEPVLPPEPTGRFEIIAHMSRTSTGRLFLARDAEFGRLVVVKWLNGRWRDDPSALHRFQLGGELAAKLEHPGIIPVYSEGRDAFGPFYTMRLVPGEDLRRAISRLHDLADAAAFSRTLRDLLGRFAYACETVHYAHSRGVLHGDLKPGNVLIGDGGDTFVTGWELARPLDTTSSNDEESSRLHLRGGWPEVCEDTVMGTPAYMSPEQALGQGGGLGPPTDIYALGGTLYHLLVGRIAVLREDYSFRAMLDYAIRGDIPPPRRVRPDVPAALEAVCLKAMALKPADRYASARNLADDVRCWLAGEPVSAFREPILTRFARRLHLIGGSTARGTSPRDLTVGSNRSDGPRS